MRPTVGIAPFLVGVSCGFVVGFDQKGDAFFGTVGDLHAPKLGICQ
jgi:hypothetical protein